MLQHTRFKYCPQCGRDELEVYQKNGILCRTCGYIYFHNAAAAVAGIIETPDGIVLIKRGEEPKKGRYDLPGGFVDYLENLETALSREIKEELNIDIQEIKYFGSFPNRYDYKKVRYFTTDAVFICKSNAISAIKPNSEVSQVHIVKCCELDLESIAFDSARSALQTYCDSRKSSPE